MPYNTYTGVLKNVAEYPDFVKEGFCQRNPPPPVPVIISDGTLNMIEVLLLLSLAVIKLVWQEAVPDRPTAMDVAILNFLPIYTSIISHQYSHRWHLHWVSILLYYYGWGPLSQTCTY